MAKKRKKTVDRLQSEVIIVIYALIILMLTIIGIQELGIVGKFINGSIRVLFGAYPWVVYTIITGGAVYLILKRQLPWLSYKKIIGLVLTLLIISLALTINSTQDAVGFSVLSDFIKTILPIYQNAIYAQGGLIGAFLYSLFSALVARNGTWVVLITMSLISIYLLVSPISWIKVKDNVQSKMPKLAKKELSDKPLATSMDQAVSMQKSKKSIFIDSEEVTRVPKVSTSKTYIDGEQEVKTKSAATISHITNYTLPPLTLLDEITVKKGSNANSIAASNKGKKLIDILSQFGINASLVATHIGPAVTKFELKPDSNIKINKIEGLQDNIKMELQAKDIRIEAPIPGRNAVGVEIPNAEMIPVRMSELMRSIPTERANRKLLFILGKDLMGKAVYGELDRMPHMLISGATGSGKSVCVNAIITTLLLRCTPDEVKMLLIDPKKVEFTQFHHIPHLIGPVISDASEAARALKVIVMMMENRYDVFSNVGVRNITAYNELVVSKPQDHLAFMPWIVVIIDELADLMIVAGKEVESSIQRITQLARAAGIHLIVATQRPSVDVITGIIKSNIPSRIAFAVSSGVDSRTILDHVGAERLLGYGDMLYIPIGEPSAVRIQGVYVSDDEVKRVAEAVSAQGKPHFDDAFIKLDGVDKNEGFVLANDDPIYEEVKNFVISSQRASTSSIQRRFGLGYNRAARLMDVMEEEGIIGPSLGSKPRDVYVKSED